jgi:hypothetical protein
LGKNPTLVQFHEAAAGLGIPLLGAVEQIPLPPPMVGVDSTEWTRSPHK